jgi:hypothetical protein
MRDLAIRRPCRESWDGMQGGFSNRFCQSCHRSVHDFSRMTRKQAGKLMRDSADGLCAKISYNPQGKILFQPDAPSRFTAKLIQLSLLGVSALAAQEPRSCNVNIKVSDPSGAPVPGSLVTITPEHNEQSALRGKADPSGTFHQAIQAGSYDLTIEMPGFRPYVKKDLSLNCEAGQPVEIDAPLQIGILMGDVVEIGPQSPWSRAKASLVHFFRNIRS